VWTLEFEVSPTTMPLARRLIGHVVEDEGGLPEVQGEVEVAVSEILLNAFRHAYLGRPGCLRIQISIDRDRLELLVQDDGPRLHTLPMIPSDRPLRVSEGMGLYMVGKLMDEAEIIHPARDGRGTTVRLVKNLRPPEMIEPQDLH